MNDFIIAEPRNDRGGCGSPASIDKLRLSDLPR